MPSTSSRQAPPAATPSSSGAQFHLLRFAPDRWPRWLPYLLALILVAATLLFRLSIKETFGARPLLILLVFPIIISAYLGGLGPGLLATLSAAGGVAYLLIPPVFSFHIHKSADFIQWLFLILNGILVSALNEALHRSRRQIARLASFPHLCPNPVLEVNSAGSVIYANPAAQAVLEKFGPHAGLADFLPPDWEEIQPTARQTGQLHFYRQIQIQDAFFGVTISFTPPLGTCRLYTTDLTRQERARQALSQQHDELQETTRQLEQSRNMLHLIIESIPARVFWKDRDLRYLGCNTLFARDAGLETPSQLLGQDDFAMGWRDQADLYRADDFQVMASGSPKMNIVEPQTTPAGDKIWLNTSKVPLQMDNGEVFGVLGVYEDITPRYQAEEALRESEARLRLFIDYAPASLAMFDKDMRYLSASRRWLRQFNLGDRDLLGLSHYDVFPDLPAHWLESHRRGLAGEVVRSRADRYTRPDGSVQWLRWEVRPWHDASGKVAGIVIFSEDITERQQADAALRDSLAEKTALLKEVHHRVKNNLQIVASLLSLQANRSDNREAITVLEDTRNRVRSMALLHEVLYRSANLARINFASYVAELCQYLRRSSGPGASRVVIDHRVASLGLPLELSLPCGLIINELVSNALKHAFPGDRPGRITISLSPAPDNHLTLSVHDDGIGLPPGLDHDATATLGLRLVSALATQLQGQLTLTSPEGGGSAFSVVFPAPPGMLLKD